MTRWCRRENCLKQIPEESIFEVYCSKYCEDKDALRQKDMERFMQGAD